jgi:hypothetical protein
MSDQHVVQEGFKAMIEAAGLKLETHSSERDNRRRSPGKNADRKLNDLGLFGSTKCRWCFDRFRNRIRRCGTESQIPTRRIGRPWNAPTW